MADGKKRLLSKACRVAAVLGPLMLMSVGLVLIGDGLSVLGAIGVVFTLVAVLQCLGALWSWWASIPVDEPILTKPMSTEDQLIVKRAVDEWRANNIEGR